MKVVIGLGNPGARYAATRHNMGFRVADHLAGRLGAVPVATGAPADVTRGEVGAFGEPVLLVKPKTFMNLSGRAVEDLGREAAFTPSAVLVILDDVYLPFGKLRLRGSGSGGGHNGLESVLQALGSEDVPRLRCGVGSPPPGMELRDYVLSAFGPAEADQVPEFVDRAALAALTWLEEGLPAAMNQYNR